MIQEAVFSVSHLLGKHLCSNFLIRYTMITVEIIGKKDWSYELRKIGPEIYLVLSVLEDYSPYLCLCNSFCTTLAKPLVAFLLICNHILFVLVDALPVIFSLIDKDAECS